MNKKQENLSFDKSLNKLINIALVVLIAGFLIYISSENTNTNEVYVEENYVEDTNSQEIIQESKTYCYNGECYTNYQEYILKKEYGDANALWQQHLDILENDRERTREILSTLCHVGESIPYEKIPSCINNIHPRLEAYANHVVNARSFVQNKGDVFENQQKLLAWLDEDTVYIKTLGNDLDTIVKDYNNWVLSQQQAQSNYQQQQEVLATLIKILAVGI